MSKGRRSAPSHQPSQTASRPPAPIDEKTAREAAAQYEREQKQREREARREEAAQEKKRKRKAKAIAPAEAASESASRIHKKKVADLEKARVALDRKLDEENER